MGKEILGATRPTTTIQRLPQTSHTPDVTQELVHQWDPQNLVSEEQVVEDAGVYITLLNETFEDRFFCTGFSCGGNRFSRLIGLLKKKRLIPASMKVKTVLVSQGFVYSKANIRKDSFFAGDRIVLILANRPRKSLKKAKKTNKKRKCRK
eukprot:TRINITY_DN9428_c0_g1_i9.p1 TRINITY_DN9428_c0_g1~~TRINITY_DN9428_c0_g1_i9.p1  ORF type:complete len:150 (-),score=15.50 TRINITY_DN9428_c0_g1_i9:243-692(-)